MKPGGTGGNGSGIVMALRLFFVTGAGAAGAGVSLRRAGISSRALESSICCSLSETRPIRPARFSLNAGTSLAMLESWLYADRPAKYNTRTATRQTTNAATLRGKRILTSRADEGLEDQRDDDGQRGRDENDARPIEDCDHHAGGDNRKRIAAGRTGDLSVSAAFSPRIPIISLV